MSQSTALPPAQPKAAELAAASGRPVSGAGETTPDGASFGVVLQSQIDKGNSVAEAPAVAPLLPSELLPGNDGAMPEVQVDPGVVNSVPSIAVAVLAVPTVTPVAPMTPAPVSVLLEQASVTEPTTVEAARLLRGPIEMRSDAKLVARLAEAPEAGAGRVRLESDGVMFDRKLMASAGGDPAVRPKTFVESAQPVPEPKPVTAAAPVIQVENAPQTIAVAEAQRETNAARSLKVDVAQPLAAPGWRDAFAERVTWVANARQPLAEMQINPPNLGPVEIRVSMNADQASLSFFSPHATVREAIQSALPRLIDAFAASGLSLGNVFVGAESQSGRDPGQSGQSARFVGRSGDEFAAVETIRQVTWLQPGVGLGRVDLFA